MRSVTVKLSLHTRGHLPSPYEGLIVSIVVLLGSLPLTALWVKKIIKWFTVKK